MSKKTGLISFSGGETSAYMLWWLLNHKKDEYNFITVFANTGRENNETLEFVKNCQEYFKLDIVWVESVVHLNKRKAPTHKIVNYDTATRNQDWKDRRDTPYEMMVKKYGVANVSSRFSTRVLKEDPIHSYMKSLGFKNKKSYDTFIGIRVDEFDRVSTNNKVYNFKYPLVTDNPTTKLQINGWWKLQPFRLNLRGWEGNCVTCYKKSDKKLARIYKDTPWKFEFESYLEGEYSAFIPEGRVKQYLKKGKDLPKKVFIFRGNKTVDDIVQLSETLSLDVMDDADQYEESCEVFSNCGIDN